MSATIPARPFITHMNLSADDQLRHTEARAFRAETERDSWAQFARTLLAEHVIKPQATDAGYSGDDLTQDTLDRIADRLFDDWSDGTHITDLNAVAHIEDEVGA